MRSLKSLLGSSLIDSQTEVQGRALPFRHLLTLFIQEVKQRADRAAGRPFEQVVLGRPVFFVDDNPKADALAEETLAQIARQVGFKDISFQFEPLAAAFDYESSITREELVLIVDIGGGTRTFRWYACRRNAACWTTVVMTSWPPAACTSAGRISTNN
jgi:hypothetical chaperone protein